MALALIQAARNRNWVTLRDPIGLYISNIDTSQFTKPDNSPIPDFQQRYWNVLRVSADGSLILRASLKVPDGETFNGKELLLGDLLVNGIPLQHGGQAANAITMSLLQPLYQALQMQLQNDVNSNAVRIQIILTLKTPQGLKTVVHQLVRNGWST